MAEQLLDIFRELTFYRVKDTQGYLLYAARLQSLTGDGERYVVLTVPNVPSSRCSSAKMQHLQWIALQTRILSTGYDIPFQQLDHRAFDTRYSETKLPMVLLSREQDMTSYSYSSLTDSLTVSLLYDPKRKSIHQYPDQMDLRHALKTFRCIVKNDS